MRLPPRLVIGTSNLGKFADWEALLRPLNVVALPVPSLEEVRETESDLMQNASRKALLAARATGLPAIADDIGLFIAALDGAPGAMLKRWAMGLGGWPQALDRAAALAGSTATYRCAVSLAQPDGTSVQALGEVRGVLVAARGTGPGLEPCFLPNGAQGVLSQRVLDERALHHRVRALDRLLGA